MVIDGGTGLRVGESHRRLVDGVGTESGTRDEVGMLRGLAGVVLMIGTLETFTLLMGIPCSNWTGLAGLLCTGKERSVVS